MRAFARAAPRRGTIGRRALVVDLALLALVASTVAVGLAVGDYPVPLRHVADALRGRAPGDATFVVIRRRQS